MKKNILIITAVFPPEPIVSANLMVELATELSHKFNVTVIHPQPTRPLGFKFNNTKQQYPFKEVIVKSYTCPKSSTLGRLKESYSFGRATVNFIKTIKKPIDLVYIAAWPLFAKYIISRTVKKYGISNIVAVQDIYPESIASKIPNIFGLQKIINTLLLPIDRYILNNANLIHTISPKMVKYLSDTRNVDEDKFLCVRNWQDEKKFQDTKIIEQYNNSLIFMYLGNIGPLAGLESVIDAFSGIDRTKVKFVIAGSGSIKDKLIERVNHNNLAVEFLEVPDGKVAEIQAKADIMILPIKKGFAKSSIPSKLPAYMFSKKPILACVDNDSDTASCIKEADCGWVVEPENTDAIRNKIIECIKIPRSELSELGKNGYEYGIQELSKTKNLQKLYEGVISLIK